MVEFINIDTIKKGTTPITDKPLTNDLLPVYSGGLFWSHTQMSTNYCGTQKPCPLCASYTPKTANRRLNMAPAGCI